ncbi:hypothetical protein K438DRAFT_1963216 [Mycena galopus ATCC 62051]|nr:hypothetical protein K438DRAFT_1963216 [Mycena galopus ATCC 62051]
MLTPTQSKRTRPSSSFCYGASAYFTGLLLTRLNTETGMANSCRRISSTCWAWRDRLLHQTREDVCKQLLQMVQGTPEGLIPAEQEMRDMAVSARDLGVLLADLISPSGSKILTPANLFPGSKEEQENYAAPAGISAAPQGLAMNWGMAGLVVEADAALQDSAGDGDLERDAQRRGP